MCFGVLYMYNGLFHDVFYAFVNVQKIKNWPENNNTNINAMYFSAIMSARKTGVYWLYKPIIIVKYEMWVILLENVGGIAKFYSLNYQHYINFFGKLYILSM